MQVTIYHHHNKGSYFMNARGQAVADRVTNVNGNEALRKILEISQTLDGMSAEEAMQWIAGLSDEKLADMVNIAMHAQRGVKLFTELFALAAMQRFEFSAADVRSALRERHDLAVVREVLGEEEEHTTERYADITGSAQTTTQGA